MSLSKGIISSIEDESLKNFYPCLFLGVVSDPTSDRIALETVVRRSGVVRGGRFLLEHKYEGHACSLSELFGIFLPLLSCPEANIRDGLIAITRMFSRESRCALHPYSLQPKEAPGITELRKEMGLLGPFEVREVSHPHGTAEAFIRFERPGEILTWCKAHDFRYIVGLTEASGSRVVSDYAIPAWKDTDDFSEWLGIPGEMNVASSQIQAALLYKNSD